MVSYKSIPPGALPEDEAAKYCGTPRETFKRIAQAGVIPRLKLGQRWVYRVDSLDAFLASSESSSRVEGSSISIDAVTAELRDCEIDPSSLPASAVMQPGTKASDDRNAIIAKLIEMMAANGHEVMTAAQFAQDTAGGSGDEQQNH